MKAPRVPIDVLLQAYLDGELSPAEEERVRRRIREDPELERQWRALRGMQEWLVATRAEVPESPPRLAEDLSAAMAEKREAAGRKAHRRGAAIGLWLAGAAAVLLIALLLPLEHWVLTNRPTRVKTPASQGEPASRSAAEAKVPYRFCLQAPAASEVCVVGDFNDWTVCSHPLNRAEGGVWCLSLPLNPGQHEYMFVVDGKWITDPRARLRREDGFGGVNSIASVRGQPA